MSKGRERRWCLVGDGSAFCCLLLSFCSRFFSALRSHSFSSLYATGKGSSPPFERPSQDSRAVCRSDDASREVVRREVICASKRNEVEKEQSSKESKDDKSAS